MHTVSEEDIRFLTDNYKPGCFDVSRAIREYCRGNHFKYKNKWLMTAVTSVACAAVAFAGGYSLALSVQKEKARKSEEVAWQNASAETGATAEVDLAFEDVPVAEVLSVLSETYGCKLSTPPTSKRLTARFSREDDLEYVVSLIEAALDITVTIEK